MRSTMSSLTIVRGVFVTSNDPSSRVLNIANAWDMGGLWSLQRALCEIGRKDKIFFASNVMWHFRDIFIGGGSGLIGQIGPDH